MSVLPDLLQAPTRDRSDAVGSDADLYKRTPFRPLPEIIDPLKDPARGSRDETKGTAAAGGRNGSGMQQGIPADLVYYALLFEVRFGDVLGVFLL
jgi:hypothetical protein